MQIEPWEIPFAGAPEIPCKERIYAFPTDVRRNKPAPCLTRGRMKGTPQMGVFQQPVLIDKRFI